MSLKIRENLKTASFDPKFTGSYKKKKCKSLHTTPMSIELLFVKQNTLGVV